MTTEQKAREKAEALICRAFNNRFMEKAIWEQLSLFIQSAFLAYEREIEAERFKWDAETCRFCNYMRSPIAPCKCGQLAIAGTNDRLRNERDQLKSELAAARQQAEIYRQETHRWSESYKEVDQLRAQLAEAHKHEADANRGAERNARVNQLLAKRVNDLTAQLAEAQAEIKRHESGEAWQKLLLVNEMWHRQRDECVKALEPFAQAAKGLEHIKNNLSLVLREHGSIYLSLLELRQAAATLAKVKGEG